MEIPLSLDSSCMPLDGRGYWSWPKRGSWAGWVGWPGRPAYSCVTSNFERSKLLRLNSVPGVFRLYGNPIESIFHPCSMEDIG